MKIAAEALIRLVYPAKCGICRKHLVLKESNLCSDCGPELRAMRFAYADMGGGLRSAALTNGWFLYPYQPPVKDILTNLKFLKQRHLVKVFKEDIDDIMEMARSESSYDWIIPIPLDRKRRLERHFNQAELIAYHVSRKLNCPVRQYLQKKHPTYHQSAFSKDERQWNIRNSFKAVKTSRIRGKSILLVDDIYTTGATASEAARVLKERGASTVDIFALARTQAEPRKAAGLHS